MQQITRMVAESFPVMMSFFEHLMRVMEIEEIGSDAMHECVILAHDFARKYTCIVSQPRGF